MRKKNLKQIKTNRMKKVVIIQVLSLLFLTSCLVGKKYVKPDVRIPDNYINSDSLRTRTDSVINVNWFKLFNDRTLNELIEKALEANNDIKNAVLRIDQSRSQYKISNATLLPSFAYNATAQFNDPDVDKFALMGTASWELDFWGRLRHAKRAAYAEMIASEEALKAVKTAVVSDVAILYFEILDLDNRLKVASNTLNSRQDFYNIVNERFIHGEVAELDKLQAEQQLASVEAAISVLEQQLNNKERSLNVLLGQEPQPISRKQSTQDKIFVPEIPAGLPSSLLEYRPDVRIAENMLIAETEKIGVAQAMRFPNFRLTGNYGLASTDISDFFSGNLSGGLAGIITGPVFEFGRNKRRVEIQKIETEIALNNYLDTFRKALADVENGLSAVNTYKKEYTTRTRQTEAARKALFLSKAKFDSGYSSYLEVLVAETYTFDAEMQLSETKTKQLTALVSLFRAMGGGW